MDRRHHHRGFPGRLHDQPGRLNGPPAGARRELASGGGRGVLRLAGGGPRPQRQDGDVVLGLGLLTGGGVSASVLAAVFISNVPEGLSSAAGMKAGGRSARYVFGVWGGIAVVSGLAALIGYLALGSAAPESPSAPTMAATPLATAMPPQTPKT